MADNPTSPEPTTATETLLQSAQAKGGATREDVERPIWQGGYSPRAMIGSWVMCVILSIALFIAAYWTGAVTIPVTMLVVLVGWIFVAGLYGYRRLGYHYELSTQRLVHRSGILTRRSDRIEVIDIDDVIYQQGPIERILGVGTIRIESSDKSHPVLTLMGIANVKIVADQIDDIRRKERRRRSLHIETV